MVKDVIPILCGKIRLMQRDIETIGDGLSILEILFGSAVLAAVILFVTEWLTVDLIAMLIIVALVTTGVISASEGLDGFSNGATRTVAFMFVLSAALLQTGALQVLAGRRADRFRRPPTTAPPARPRNRVEQDVG